MYGLTGVCKVADIRKESAGNQRGEEYFILHPVKDEHSKIMIPVSRGKARMRPLVNKTEVMKFMEDMTWIPGTHNYEGVSTPMDS